MNQNIYIQNGVLVISSKIKDKIKVLHSMRFQILVVLILLGIVPMYIFSWMQISSYKEQSLTEMLSEVEYQGTVVANRLASIGYFEHLEDGTQGVDSHLVEFANIYKGRIFLIDNQLQIVQDSYGLAKGKRLVSQEMIHCLQGNSAKIIDEKNQYMMLTIPVYDLEGKEIQGALLLSFSTKKIGNIYQLLKNKAVIFILVISIIVILFAFYYAGRIIQPLDRVADSMDRVTEGYMDETLSIKGFTEIERISDSFNQMLGKLQTLENSRQEFVSNVSHELKTPMTSIKVLADSLLQQDDLPVELYREFLVDINDEIERENKIITDLLSLVKLDKTAAELNITTIKINDLLEQILKRLRPIAAKRNIELVFESYRPVIAEVDEIKLSLAINNLIENAIKYNYDNGWVGVSLNADHKFFYIKVSDTGVGIPEDEQENIFERFYRVDKARSRETGGTGLGLSITRNAILLHRGAIKVYSREKEGTTFTVRIPLNYVV